MKKLILAVAILAFGLFFFDTIGNAFNTNYQKQYVNVDK